MSNRPGKCSRVNYALRGVGRLPGGTIRHARRMTCIAEWEDSEMHQVPRPQSNVQSWLASVLGTILWVTFTRPHT